MSSKGNNQTVKVNHPDDVRNVVLIGNAGSGKTSLFESLLRARVEGYRGEKDDAERLSQLYLASLVTGSTFVNLLDAPGHPDFISELRAGIRAADAAIFVVSGADGIDGAAQALWEECAAANLPRVIALTKMDAAYDDFDTLIGQLQDAFGDGVLPTHLPIGSGENIKASIGVLSKRFRDYAKGEAVITENCDDYDDMVEDHRAALIEAIIEEAEDGELMDAYLEGNIPGRDYLLTVLRTATATANLYPVIPVVASNGIGTSELLSLIEMGFPTPTVSPNPTATKLNGEDFGELSSAPDAPLVAQVIRTTTDPFAGKLSMVRIFSGTLKADSTVHVSRHQEYFLGKEDPAHPDHDTEARIGQIQVAVGSELKPKTSAMAGEIVMLPKLDVAGTGDTISDLSNTCVVENWPMPEPLLPLAIKAATRNDEDKLSGALQRLAVEDSSVRLARGAEEQLVLWTNGQAHADLLLNRLKDRYGVNVVQEDVKIALRETFVGSCEVLGRHVKQSGGHGQYAVCNIKVEPLPRGGGFEFVDKVVGGAVPRQFIPSVEKGAKAQLDKGVIAGYPVVDTRITLFDGKAHSVDSSDMAFQMAAAAALKEAASKPGMVALLEPIDEVAITVGEEYMGAIMTDISGRRGQVLGSDQDGRKVIIRALVPQLELSRYAIDLRGLAQGSGTFTREFHGYELLPNHLIENFTKKDD